MKIGCNGSPRISASRLCCATRHISFRPTSDILPLVSLATPCSPYFRVASIYGSHSFLCARNISLNNISSKCVMLCECTINTCSPKLIRKEFVIESTMVCKPGLTTWMQHKFRARNTSLQICTFLWIISLGTWMPQINTTLFTQHIVCTWSNVNQVLSLQRYYNHLRLPSVHHPSTPS